MTLKTTTVGAVGAATGGVTIIGALVGLFAYLTNTDNLYALVLAVGKIQHNVQLDEADVRALVSLGGVVIALVGAISISLIGAWLGKSPLPTTPPQGTP